MKSCTDRVCQKKGTGQSLQRKECSFSQAGLRGLRRLLRLKGLAFHRPLPPYHLAMQWQVQGRGTLPYSLGRYGNRAAAFHSSLQSDDGEPGADHQGLRSRALTDFAELDAEIERQLEETQVVAELVKAAVKENASTAQSQEAYLRKYEALTERYEKAAAELERLQSLHTTQSQQDKAMALYIRTLKKQPVVLREWDSTIWTVMVEKAIVHRDGAITFVFKNGTEIKVGE